MNRLTLIFLIALLLCSPATALQKKKTRPTRKPSAATTHPPVKAENDEPLFDFSDVATPAEWVLATTMPLYDVLFSPKRLTRQPNGIARTWIKYSLRDDREANVKANIIEGKAVQEQMSLEEYDCNNARHRLLSLIKYDSEGKPLDSIEPEKPGWSYVIPESVGERLMKKVCGYK